MAKHTPGPWNVRPNPGPSMVSEHGDDPFTIERDGRFIAAVKQQRGESDANARLIAAAPELLDKLTEAVELFRFLAPYGIGDTAEEIAEFVSVAQDTIRKATGE